MSEFGRKIYQVTPDVFQQSWAMNPLGTEGSWVCFALGLVCIVFLFVRYFREQRNTVIPVGVSFLATLFFSLHYNFLPDDAFAHLRIVRNLISGEGYVWNPGMKVEGTATPFWHVLLSFGAVLPLGWVAWSRVLSALCLLFFLFSLRSFSFRYKFADGKNINLLMALACLNPVVILYCLAGMETLFYCGLCFWFLHFLVRNNWYVVLLLGLLLFWTRFDGLVVVCGAFFGYQGFCIIQSRRPDLGRDLFTKWIFPFLILVLITQFARYLYFGEAIPHVVKMKIGNISKLLTGLNYLTGFFLVNGIGIVAILICVVLQIKAGKTIKGFTLPSCLLFFSAISILASVILGGGDWMPGYRYLVYPAIAVHVFLIGCFGSKTLLRSEKYWVGFVLVAGFLQLFSLYYSPWEPIKSIYGFYRNRTPLEYVISLRNSAKGLYTLGNVTNAVTVDEDVLYTRWIGYVPFFADRSTLDELTYFTRWARDNTGSFLMTTKPGHLIEAVHMIPALKPDVITNVSTGNMARHLEVIEMGIDDLKDIEFKLRKKIPADVRRYILNHYDITIGAYPLSNGKYRGVVFLTEKEHKPPADVQILKLN